MWFSESRPEADKGITRQTKGSKVNKCKDPCDQCDYLTRLTSLASKQSTHAPPQHDTEHKAGISQDVKIKLLDVPTVPLSFIDIRHLKCVI